MSSPVYAVVSRGRGQRGKRKAPEFPRVFEYEKNAVVRQLRDEGKKELAERANQRNVERKKAVESRHLAMEEKRRLAVENELRQNEECETRKNWLEAALAALVENRTLYSS